MKKCIKCQTDDNKEYPLTLKGLLSILKDAGIDTTVHNYELYAQEYERYEEGKKYHFRFKAPGDYLAYFSMTLHRHFNKDELLELIGEILEAEDSVTYTEFFEVFPTSVAEYAEHVSSVWWGDGDDYIIRLTNLDTGEVLYEGEEPESDYEADEDWEY